MPQEISFVAPRNAMIRIPLLLMVMLFGAATLLQAQEGAPEKRRRPSARSNNSPQTDSLLSLLNIRGMRWDSLLARVAATNQSVPDRSRTHKDARLLGEMPPVLSRMIAGKIQER